MWYNHQIYISELAINNKTELIQATGELKNQKSNTTFMQYPLSLWALGPGPGPGPKGSGVIALLYYYDMIIALLYNYGIIIIALLVHCTFIALLFNVPPLWFITPWFMGC